MAADCSTRPGAVVPMLCRRDMNVTLRTIQRRASLRSNEVQLLWPNMNRTLQHNRFGIQHARTLIALVDRQVFMDDRVNVEGDLEAWSDKAKDHRHRSIGHAEDCGGPTILTMDRV